MQVPIILRGDLIPSHGLLFLDVEKISLKMGVLPTVKGKYGHRQVGMNVGIVDQKGLLVLWAFIYRDPSSICQYFTSITKLDQAKVENGVSLNTVQIDVFILLFYRPQIELVNEEFS
jgi:hypothetical protein